MHKDMLWQSDTGDGHFKNPILFADYSDPDVIRVDDTYYMTASSFNYTPGLPILISKDLVHWELKNYAIKNISFDRYEAPAHSKGIWAPSIRYHDNKFWICYGMPDEGIFVIRAEDPLGKWSEPELVLPGKGYIDACLFWDDDGKAYIIHGYARSRIGFKSFLGIFPVSWDGAEVIGEDCFIYDGTRTQPTIEGPKVYKRDGWYYIFAPAGGVTQGWQTVLRSKHIEGPYEEKIVMAQGNTPVNGPHQGALVDTPSGEEWFVHFQDRGFYGRITHIQPVHWKDGWPVIGINPNESGCGEPCLIHKKPQGLPTVSPTYLAASDDFSGNSLGLQWQWLGNHKESFCQLMGEEKALRLYSLNPSGDNPVTLWRSSNVLTQKIICPSYKAEVSMSLDGLGAEEQAGIVIMGGQYAYLAVRKTKDHMDLVFVQSEGDGDTRDEIVVSSLSLDVSVTKIYFRTTLSDINGKMTVKMFYSPDGNQYHAMDRDFIPTDHTWVGSKIGVFASAMDQESDHGYVDVHYVNVDAYKA